MLNKKFTHAYIADERISHEASIPITLYDVVDLGCWI